MNERHLPILMAARTVFARYGVNKTTMNDIAAEAGVARQTVYNAFQNKNDILKAVVRMDHRETYAVVTACWAEMTDVGDMIDLFFEHAPLRWYALVQDAPDMQEVIEGVHAAASEELAETEKEWKAGFHTALESLEALPVSPDMTLADVAEFFYFASVNAKYGAADIKQLKQRLMVVRMAILALLRSG